MASPWRVTIGRLTVEWTVAARIAGLDERTVPAAPPPDPTLRSLPVAELAAQLAEGAQVLLDARPRRSAARATPATQGAAWRSRVDAWIGELGG